MGKVYGNWVTDSFGGPEGGGVPIALRASLKTNTNLTNLTNARKNIRVIAQGASNL